LARTGILVSKTTAFLRPEGVAPDGRTSRSQSSTRIYAAVSAVITTVVKYAPTVLHQTGHFARHNSTKLRCRHVRYRSICGMRWERYIRDGIFGNGIFGNGIFGVWVMWGTLPQNLLASLLITARPAKHDFMHPFASLSLPIQEMDVKNMVF
jgi:hypothetical protein